MTIEARLRAVDRLYARKRPETSLSNIRWAELRKLFRYKLGPEPSKQDLDNAIREAVGGDPMALSAASIGEAVKLTLAQRGYLDIRTMMPIDATPTQLKAFYRERKRERDRKRWRKRANVKEVSNMQTNVSRLDVLRDVIRTSHDKDPAHWMTVEEMAEAVRRKRAFCGLSAGSLRTVIHRVLDRLADETEQDTAIGDSLPTRLVRLKLR